MNLETRKFNLINWITNLQNEDIINYLELLQKEHPTSWEDLPETVRDGIEEAQHQAKNELFITNEQQIEKHKTILI